MLWEIVIKRNGIYEKALVLDNIESLGRVPIGDLVVALEKLKEYKYIFLGTKRNDIDGKPIVYTEHSSFGKTFNKPYSVVGGEGSFKAYGNFDDSHSLYTLVENNFTDKPVCRNFEGERDLYLAAYLERFIYSLLERVYDDTGIAMYTGKYTGDENFLLINPVLEASYIIETKGEIIGYVVSHLLTDNVVKEFELAFDDKDKVDYSKTLYISDFVITSYSGLKFIKKMLKEIMTYCRRNKLNTVAFSYNLHSEKYVKYFEKARGIRFVKEVGSIVRHTTHPIFATKPAVIVEELEIEHDFDDDGDADFD